MAALGNFLAVLAGFFQFYDDVKAFLAFRKSVSDAQWAKDTTIITDAIKGATTDAQRADLARRLAGQLGG